MRPGTKLFVAMSVMTLLRVSSVCFSSPRSAVCAWVFVYVFMASTKALLRASASAAVAAVALTLTTPTLRRWPAPNSLRRVRRAKSDSAPPAATR